MLKKFVLLLLVACSCTEKGQTADWPQRDVKIYVGFTAGGTTDIIARLLSVELHKAWGQPVVIDNRPGATGNIAAEVVVKSPPDGYALLMGTVGPLAINASLFKKMPYDNLKDLTPISLVAHLPNMLVVNPNNMPVANFDEFLKLVKSNPGKYFYASTGSGTSSHLSAELLKMQAGLEMTHVPYKGAAALNDLLSGEVHLMFATIPSAINHVRSGKLRALAVTSIVRSAGVPELPTVAESGFPGFDASSWVGLVGPANLPPEVTKKISVEVQRILRIPEMRTKLLQLGADPVGSTPEEFGAHMRSETEKWAKLVKSIGVVEE